MRPYLLEHRHRAASMHALRGIAWTIPLFLAGCAQSAPADVADSQPLESFTRTVRLAPLFAGDNVDLEYDFPIKNETNRTLRFTHVRKSCACMGSTSVGADELAPGAETKLHLAIDLRRRTGPQRLGCSLVEAGGSEWNYAIETTIYERARFEPAVAIHFGMVDPKSLAERETQLVLAAKTVGDLPEKLSLSTNSEFVRVVRGAAVDESPDGIAVRKHTFQLKLQAPAIPGFGQAQLHAVVDDKGTERRIQTAVTWNVRSLFTVSPSQAFFGTIPIGEQRPLTRQLAIRREDGQPLNIAAVTTNCPQVKCTVARGEDVAVAVLSLTLATEALQGPLWGELKISTDHPIQPIVKVPFAALAERPE